MDKKSLILNERQVCDLELIINGGYKLQSFMNKNDYDSVLNSCRDTSGNVFGLPVLLDATDDPNEFQMYETIKLISHEYGGYLADLSITDIFLISKPFHCFKLYKTTDLYHPAVEYTSKMKNYCITGKLNIYRKPQRNWVQCMEPKVVNAFHKNDKGMVAFQCRNPIHKAHFEMFKRVAESTGMSVLIHPVIGPTKNDDFGAKSRVESYEAIKKYLPKNTHLEYLPYNMVVGGPREALQHAVIRKNYGCTHIIIGRDHAGCKEKNGNDYYEPYESQELVSVFQDEIGIKMIPFKMMVYCPDINKYKSIDELDENEKYETISGTQFRNKIYNNEKVPEWFAFPECVNILKQFYSIRNSYI